MPGPAIVLVNPTLPENIGSAARAMANFGLTDLRLVSPACDPKEPRAIATATHGRAVLEGARVYDALGEALADRRQVWATTALDRTFRKPTHTPEQAARQLQDDSAVVFGSEASGLTYEQLTWSHALLTFPTTPEARALNLGVAVALVSWEWARAGAFAQTLPANPPGEIAPGGFDGQDRFQRIRAAPIQPAAMGEQLRLLGELEERLEAAGWASEPGLHERTLRSLRTMVLRAQFTTEELTLWRSVFRALDGRGRQ